MAARAINSLIGDQQKKELRTKIWEAADVFRDKISIVQQMNYMTGFMFYRYLSEQLEEYVNRDLVKEQLSYTHTHTQEVTQIYKDYSLREYGYFLEPKYSWKEIIRLIKNGDTSWVVKFKSGMKQIEDGSKAFNGLFEAVDLDNTKLSKDPTTRRIYFEDTLKSIDSINISFNDSHIDILGETYEYLLGRFFESSISEAGKFYTPQAVSEIMAKIVTHNKKQAKNIYDPTCGTGSLLFKVYKQLEGHVSHLYGQDTDGDNIALAKMNMLLHGVGYESFDLVQEDTLLNPQHKDIKMDIVVANPPYNKSKWMLNRSKDEWLSDDRFNEWGAISKDGNADWMFVAHMLYQLSNTGVCATLFDTSLLTRGGVEKTMREFAINKNWVDAVILLPPKIFNKTGTQACLTIFRKNKTTKDIIFINAENEFIKGSNMNLIKEENINNIVNTYVNRKDKQYLSKVIKNEQVIQKQGNLNVSEYVEKEIEEVNIDINKVISDYLENNKKLDKLWSEFEKQKKELVEV